MKEITLEDKKIFDSFFKLYPPQVSELTFTNLFMWRKRYNFRYHVVDGYLYILSLNEKHKFILPPVGEVAYSEPADGPVNMHDNFHGDEQKLLERFADSLKQISQICRDQGVPLVFERVPKEMLEWFKKASARLGKDIDIQYDRDNSDYVYLAQGLINLKGKKYDGKRNHINKFKKTYAYEYVKFAPEHVPYAIEITEEWCRQKNCDCENDIHCEKNANIELLNNIQHLNVTGALIKVDGQFQAYTVGEMLNADTAVIHIEKANFSINGLYAFINNQFCANEWHHATYINREQDLGEEGLRKAKLSYNPYKIIDKYTIKFV